MVVRLQYKKNRVNGSAREAIYRQMLDGQWYTLRELAFIAGITEAGASARIRDLRKSQYGGFTIEARPGNRDHTWLYRLSK